MRVIGASSWTQAQQVGQVFKTLHPDLHANATQMQQGWTCMVAFADQLEEAKALDLTLLDGDLGFQITWADGSVQTIPVIEVDELVAEAPKLPTCTGFQGQGARCTSCRIRKPLHA